MVENSGAFVNMTPQSLGMMSDDRVGKKLTRRSTSEGSNGGLSAFVTLISKSTVGSLSCLSTLLHKFFKAVEEEEEEDVETDSSDECRDRSMLDDFEDDDDDDDALYSNSSLRLICRNTFTAAFANPK